MKREVETMSMNVIFEMTSPGTPQQNGKVERMIATLWGQLRACMYGGGFNHELRECLFAEILSTLTNLNNVRSGSDGSQSPYVKCYGFLPQWAKHLKTIGEVG